MTQQVNVKFVDDLDGSDAAATVSFGLDGRPYGGTATRRGRSSAGNDVGPILQEDELRQLGEEPVVRARALHRGITAVPTRLVEPAQRVLIPPRSRPPCR